MEIGMTTYTREQIQQLSGRELDRAVSEIVFKCEYETTRKVMDQDGAMYGGRTVVIFPNGGPLSHQRRDGHPPFTTDGTLWELFFQPGGVLETVPVRIGRWAVGTWFVIDWDQYLSVQQSVAGLDEYNIQVPLISRGSNPREAICRAACIVALEKLNGTI